MTDRNFKPDSGTELVFEDAGSTDRLRITDGGSTILYEDGGAAALTIDTDGNVDIANQVGIGTTAGLNILHIKSADPCVWIEDTESYGPDAVVDLRFAEGTGPDNWCGLGMKSVGLNFYTGDSGNTATGGGTVRMTIAQGGGVNVVGAFSKGSGSFKIDHPLETKSETRNLIHSFIEGPQADLIYRGIISLIDGSATINIDTESHMTEGTFSALCASIQCFTTNETGWTPIKGSVAGNILTITANDESCTDTISWMVIGERKDKHMIETEWTDENGKVIVEPEKETETQET